jgi:NAD(P)-dependent dehydrogenase (short-subunit alcohol dehydrogenase family)
VTTEHPAAGREWASAPDPADRIDVGDLFSLVGKTALVTGASSGLGKRMACTLHAAGARVVLVSRRPDLLNQMAEALPGCVAVPADLSDEEEVDALWARAEAACGPIDILVNNAAFIAGGARAESETRDQIRQTLDVNLVAPIRIGQRAFLAMKEHGMGSIINVSSIVAMVGIGRLPQATYAASKGGLLAITREWAAQWSRFGVRVNALVPGFFESEMTADILRTEKIQEWVKANVFLGRPGRPSDFDGAILYLASDASSYVTGQALVVDGGWTAR